MYKFAAEGSLIENMYLMISIFKKYNIKPIFVFDGRPPKEKKDILTHRRNEKKAAEHKYAELNAVLTNTEIDDVSRQNILMDMESLKKQFVRIKDSDIAQLKKLMNAYGVAYYDAMGEADVLCCQLVKTGVAWACVSDDMDMFVYGCSRVIRHFSMINHTVLFYDTKNILSEINMSENDFRDIMVLSGTDYNSNSETNLNETLKWYSEYNKKAIQSSLTFYEWLIRYTKYIKDGDALNNIKNMFNLDHYDTMQIVSNSSEQKEINKQDLINILSTEGFIFV
jgi:5'-3' exonuclease